MSKPTIERVALRLPESQWFSERHSKDLVVLHHTVGGSARSTVAWWRQDPQRIGTAYVIERDGTIYEAFPPEAWAYHLGVKGNGAIERRSIGIELASEGALRSGAELNRLVAALELAGVGPFESDFLYAFDIDVGRPRQGRPFAAAKRLYHLLDAGRYVDLGPGATFRGYRYFDAYEAAQTAAAVALTGWLLERFRIPALLPVGVAAPPAAGGRERAVAVRGVVGHTYVRDDKSDPSPAFPWLGLASAIGAPLEAT